MTTPQRIILTSIGVISFVWIFGLGPIIERFLQWYVGGLPDFTDGRHREELDLIVRLAILYGLVALVRAFWKKN